MKNYQYCLIGIALGFPLILENVEILLTWMLTVYQITLQTLL